MSYNGASTEAHVVFAFGTIVLVVSFVLSLVVVVAIGLPLVREPEKRTPAASFNLYIVLLSLTDAAMVAGGVGSSVVFYCVQWEGTESPGEIVLAILEQHVPPWFYAIGIFFCTTVLTWTVPLVGGEVLELLRNSKQRKRCKPPTLRRVALHCMVACAAGITSYVLALFVDLRDDMTWRSFLCSCLVLAIVLVPVPWTLWIVFRIFREGLMRFGAGVGNRLRVLVVYFGRIVLVYCVMIGCLAIAAVLSLLGMPGMDFGVAGLANTFLIGIQGWVNFAVIRTKPDVGKMIRDLLVGTACRSGGSNQTGSHGRATSTEATHWQTEPATTTRGDEDAEDGGEEGREGNGNNGGARLSVHELVSRKFIEGIEDYLSGDEGDDDGDADADAGVAAEAGGTAVVDTADAVDVGAGADEEAI